MVFCLSEAPDAERKEDRERAGHPADHSCRVQAQA